jgi:hypothetical protein
MSGEVAVIDGAVDDPPQPVRNPIASVIPANIFKCLLAFKLTCLLYLDTHNLQ